MITRDERSKILELVNDAIECATEGAPNACQSRFNELTEFLGALVVPDVEVEEPEFPRVALTPGEDEAIAFWTTTKTGKVTSLNQWCHAAHLDGWACNRVGKHEGVHVAAFEGMIQAVWE